MAIGPETIAHGALVEASRFARGFRDVVFFGVVLGTMLVAEGFELGGAVELGEGAVVVLHFEEEVGATGAGDVEGLVAELVAALDAGAHSLLADIACEFPACFRNLFYIHHWLHEGMIAE